MKPIIPEAALQQHIAVLGKTGAGKTSTAKLLVEYLAARGARVCVLDPIKSDWWGITSSADGKKPGLPFHILGGPHGHVPLHSSAGRAIGELVGSGKLPLSVIDMADFEAGGLHRFFVDFAPALLKSMRGVLYLVMEEAHEFAPKERAGFSQENMAIHFAKKLATAGRSKGIRLIVATNATQLLHNRVLGSCETMIVHRFTAPADQEPVIKWLKANATAGIIEMVAAQLSSLRTGAAWVCSGEAKVFERMEFPRIKTYDNSATPTDDAHTHDVKTAPVDLEKLKATIGDAVKEAEANDPKLLRAEISKLKADAAKRPTEKVLAVDHDAVRAADEAGYKRGLSAVALWSLGEVALVANVVLQLREITERTEAVLTAVKRRAARVKQEEAAPVKHNGQFANKSFSAGSPTAPAPRPKIESSYGVDPSPALGRRAERMALTALAQYPEGRSKRQVAILAGYAVSGGGFRNALGALRTAGYIEGDERLTITPAGVKVLGAFEPLPRGRALLEHWLRQLDRQAERKALEVITDAYPRSLSPQQIANLAGYEAEGGGFRNALGKLRTLELIKGSREIKASEELFDG